jgi:hypothetical protein
MCHTYPTLSAFPDPGEDEAMYLAENTGAVYRYTRNADDTDNEYVPLRGTDAAEKPVFLTQEEYDALEDPADSGLYPSLAGKRVVITDGNDVEYNYFAVPDYENIETVSRISTIDGSWTADRMGYVRMSAYITTTANTEQNMFVAIGSTVENRVVVDRVYNHSGGIENIRLNSVYEVEKGQTIWVIRSSGSTFGGIGCYFIPPKFTKILPPKIVVEEPRTYVYEEVDTGKTWITGYPIYRKCYSGTFTPSGVGTGSVNVILDTFNDVIFNFVACGGGIVVGSGHKRPLTYLGGDHAGTNFNFYSVSFNNTTSQLIFVHKDSASETLVGSYEIWVEYTKDTH